MSGGSTMVSRGWGSQKHESSMLEVSSTSDGKVPTWRKLLPLAVPIQTCHLEGHRNEELKYPCSCFWQVIARQSHKERRLRISQSCVQSPNEMPSHAKHAMKSYVWLMWQIVVECQQNDIAFASACLQEAASLQGLSSSTAAFCILHASGRETSACFTGSIK